MASLPVKPSTLKMTQVARASTILRRRGRPVEEESDEKSVKPSGPIDDCVLRVLREAEADYEVAKAQRGYLANKKQIDQYAEWSVSSAKRAISSAGSGGDVRFALREALESAFWARWARQATKQ